MNVATALEALKARGDPAKAAEMAAYHKAPRPYLGVAVPRIDALVREWREGAAVRDECAPLLGSGAATCTKRVSSPRGF